MTSRGFFWFRKPANYGDILTPYILKKLRIRHHFADRHSCTGLMVGSIAKLARPGVHIFGSGFIRRNDKICPSAKYHWVRGPISRQMIINAGGGAPELYGDAALLLPEFIKASEKDYDIGYVPHHVDFRMKMPGLKIDLLQGGVEHITKEITRCRKIISSSLHGIIVAHAYGIPAAWVKLSDRLSGDGMKFYDHYKSVGLEASLSTLENPIFQVPTNIEIEHMKRILRENSL